jgi:hypothetical protein
MIRLDHNQLGIVRLTGSIRHARCSPSGDEVGHPVDHELVEIVEYRKGTN